MSVAGETSATDSVIGNLVADSGPGKGGVIGDLFAGDVLAGVKEGLATAGEATAQFAADTGKEIAIKRATGFGTLWTTDAGGFRFTGAGQLILGGLAAYGVFRLLGK